MMTQADLPAGWAEATIGQLCLVNPRSFANIIGDDCPVSFVPMAAVEAAVLMPGLAEDRPGAAAEGPLTPPHPAAMGLTARQVVIQHAGVVNVYTVGVAEDDGGAAPIAEQPV